MNKIETNEHEQISPTDMTVKEYAEHAGKSDVAVYRQIHRDKYKDLWDDGHIYKDKTGKTYLDEYAVTSLDGSKMTVVVKDETYKAKYQQLQFEKKQWIREKEEYEVQLARIRSDTEERFAQLNQEHAKALEGISASFRDAIDIANRNASDSRLLADKSNEKLQLTIDENASLKKELQVVKADLDFEKSKTWLQKLFGIK